ncbi:hypothetical protein FUA26_03840 [Seonamhaeicola algicola]|uniref:Uncharacterized protein n=1 Tax=Seonamhaeicola algicola TaxID=1719036 RepID=A0A5C7AVV4_9FLAO|nr:hypothetical protein [Seonamhaeicola algicola]TXE12936.1 hypothetical protein FUA26_03840 [Seonamhaeicola algicola]
MTTFFLEANFDGIIYLILAIMFGPAVFLTLIGFLVRRKSKKAATVLFIIAAVYVIVSLGICGTLMAE